MKKYLSIFLLVLFSATTISAEKKIVSTLPMTSETIEGFNYGFLLSRLKEMSLHHIEGVWQFPSTGVEVAIVRADEVNQRPADGTTVYNIILISSPNRALRQGTIMGIVTPATKRGEYDANIYTSNIASRLTMPKRFTLTLTDDDTSLLFRQHRSKFSINLWRLLPYLWRHAIHPNTPEKSTDGCIRVFPLPALPREPIYL